jgi:hypothetical protein
VRILDWAFIQPAISARRRRFRCSALSLVVMIPAFVPTHSLDWVLRSLPSLGTQAITSIGGWHGTGLAIVGSVVGLCLGAWCKARLGLWSLVTPAGLALAALTITCCTLVRAGPPIAPSHRCEAKPSDIGWWSPRRRGSTSAHGNLGVVTK